MLPVKEYKKRLLLTAFLTAVPFAVQAEAAPVNGGQEEVIVTAQHRRENVQKSSVSIEVLSAKTLQNAGVSQATDLPRIAPGVQITQGGTALQIYIRGAGDFSTTAFSNSAVAQNFDGVSAARTQYVGGSFFDLARVEVLKGPQGTLYGRNAVGGALNMVPQTPKLGVTEGFFSVGIQNYNGTSAEGAINLPVGETAAFRLAGQVVNRDGYISDGTNDDVHESVRAQFLYQPNDDVTLRILGNMQHMGGKGTGYVVYEPNTTLPYAVSGFSTPIIPSDRWTSIMSSINTLTAALPAGNPAVPNGTTIFPIDTTLTFQDVSVYGVNAHLDWNLGFATLTLIPAYQNVEINAINYPTFKYEAQDPITKAPQTSEATSFEARLGNSGDKAKWVVGAYYFNEDQFSASNASFGNFGGGNTNFIASLNTESYAAFADINYAILDNFRVIAGVRYTEETKSVDARQYALPGTALTPPTATLVQCNVGTAGIAAATGPNGMCPLAIGSVTNLLASYKANRTNYRLGWEFDISEENMLFATVATGFKSGGQTNADLPPYAPEDLTAYTIGSRNRFFDDQLQLNLELFYIEYENHQENVSRPDRTGRPVSSLTNAGTATSQGVTIDTVYRPSRNDMFRLGVEYNKAEYDSFVYLSATTSGAQPFPSIGCKTTKLPSVPTGQGFASSVTAVFEVDCSGMQMTRTPTWSGSFSYTHTWNLANGGKLELSPDLTFASSRWLEPSFVPNARAEEYVVYNASVTYSSPGNKYSVQGFVRNITDEAVYTGGQQRPIVFNGYVGKNIDAPQTYGARVRVNF